MKKNLLIASNNIKDAKGIEAVFQDLEDIRLLDAAHKKRQLEKSVSRKKQPQTQPQNSNRFNNFHQRDYDFAEYEKKLLNNSTN